MDAFYAMIIPMAMPSSPTPPGFWGGAPLPWPTPPIHYPPPPPGIWPSPGVPTPPIYYPPEGLPPGIWPSPGVPSHPIVLPPEGLPPDINVPADKALLIVYVPGAGYKAVVIPKPGPPGSTPPGASAPTPHR
jgi:hypothetical protein